MNCDDIDVLMRMCTPNEIERFWEVARGVTTPAEWQYLVKVFLMWRIRNVHDDMADAEPALSEAQAPAWFPERFPKRTRCTCGRKKRHTAKKYSAPPDCNQGTCEEATWL